MLRIVLRPPLSANVTLQQRNLPAATRGVATPRSNHRSRLSLSHLASPPSHRARRVQSLFESPPGSLSIRNVPILDESPWSNLRPLSTRSDPAQSNAPESPTENDGAVDGQHDINQAATAGLDAPAAELANDPTEAPPSSPDAVAAEFVQDLTDNDLLGQLYSPATETAKDPTKENLPPRLDARATEAAKDLAGEHLPSEPDGPATDVEKDLAGEHLPSELNGPATEPAKDFIEDHFSPELGSRAAESAKDLTEDPSDQPESVTHASPQLNVPIRFVGGPSEPSEQETVTESSPSKPVQRVQSRQPSSVRILNLPDNITTSMLLNAISIHGPFGRVSSAKVRNVPSNTWALIDFVSKIGARSLFEFIGEGKLIIDGRVVGCQWYHREHGINHKPWRTRVLVVAMNQDLVGYTLLGRLRALSRGGARRPDVVIEPILTAGLSVALVCTYLDEDVAQIVYNALTRDGLGVLFGADPVEQGIIPAYETNLRFGERLMVTILRRQGSIEDRAPFKSFAELVEERLEQRIKPPPPPPPPPPVYSPKNRSRPPPAPVSKARNTSLDPFAAMPQAAYQPTARRAPPNNSFSFHDELEEWERPQAAYQPTARRPPPNNSFPFHDELEEWERPQATYQSTARRAHPNDSLSFQGERERWERSQAAYQPTAKRAPPNDFSFPDELEQWERSEFTEPGLDGPRFATSPPAGSRSNEFPAIEKRPDAERRSRTDGARDPQSEDETADALEGIGKVLERFRKDL